MLAAMIERDVEVTCALEAFDTLYDNYMMANEADSDNSETREQLDEIKEIRDEIKDANPSKLKKALIKLKKIASSPQVATVVGASIIAAAIAINGKASREQIDHNRNNDRVQRDVDKYNDRAHADHVRYDERRHKDSRADKESKAADSRHADVINQLKTLNGLVLGSTPGHSIKMNQNGINKICKALDDSVNALK